MDDCWLENEEFNFDIPLELSPASGEKCDNPDVTNMDENDDYDDEVFFGPVGHLERCAAVAAKKENVTPLKPLEPAEQALLLQESAKLSCLLKLKPLSAIQNCKSGPMIYPFKRDSSGIDIKKLKLFRDKLSSKDDKENMENDGGSVDGIQSKAEVDSVKQKKKQVGNSLSNDGARLSRSSPSPSCKPINSHHKSFNGIVGGRMQTKETSIPMGPGTSKIQSKIARPSSIPSLKPGLLQGQTRLRGAPSQDSKLKPLKALKSTSALINGPTSTLTHGPTAVTSNKRATPSASANKFVTPKRNSEAKHVRSNTGEKQTRRRSTELSTPMCQLQLSRPAHNSTPILVQRPVKQGSSLRRSIGSTVTSTKVSSSATPSCATNTPTKVKSGKLVDSANKEKKPETPNNKSTLCRRSLVPKPNSTHGNTPLRAKSGQRRGSLLKYPNTSKLSPDKKKSGDGNTSMGVSNTFVINAANDKPSGNPTGKTNVSLIDIGVNELDSTRADHVIATRASPQRSVPIQSEPDVLQQPLPDTSSDKHLAHQGDMLVPEVPTVYASPLLKFDSPLPDHTISDPFATGNTPPSLPVSDCVLAPEQMEANLIQF